MLIISSAERVEDRDRRTSHSQAQSKATSPRLRQPDRPPTRVDSTTQENDTPVKVVKRGPLTKRNLRAHTKSTMPRQKEGAAAASSPTSPTSTSIMTDKAFGVQLKKNKIFYGRVKTVKPSDFDSIQDDLKRRRESKSPDENDYKKYVTRVEHAGNEQTMLRHTWPLLAKDPDHTPGYEASYSYQWTEVESALAYKIFDAKPDISESFRINQYPLEAREVLGGALAPTQYGAAMPSFCAEYKGPDEVFDSAEKQCAYDGALMVEAASEAHKFMKKPLTELLNKTQAITVALNGNFVQQYSNHMVKHGHSIEYHQYPLSVNTPTASLEDFRKTYRRVRNCQDWARRRAARTKDALHTYVNAQHEASEWIWDLKSSRYYRTHPDGSVEWIPLPPSDPAVTPPSTTTPADKGLGKVDKGRSKADRGRSKARRGGKGKEK